MEFCLPDLGEGIVEAELVQWMIKPGDTVSRGQNIAEVMTDKAAVELPSPFAGTVSKLLIEPGQSITVGSAMASFEPDTVESPAAPASRPNAAAKPAMQTIDSQPRPTATVQTSKSVAAPSVRRMARKLGIDLSKIQGSGPNNRVLIGDLPTGDDAPSLPDAKPDNGSTDRPKSGQRIPLQGLRRTIAQRMSHATQTIPHFSYVDEVDMTDLVRIRGSLKERYASKGIKLTYLPFIINAAVAALKSVPQANASLDSATNEIVLHDQYHIGIATDTPGGLLVPVIRNADQKSIEQIATELTQLITATREGKAKLDQLQGSTFTVTSTGGIGGLISTPIINEPNVGIMGIGQIVKRPRFDEHDNVHAAHVAYLSFSFDHRVVDGADAARFANVLIDRLKNPAVMLVD